MIQPLIVIYGFSSPEGTHGLSTHAFRSATEFDGFNSCKDTLNVDGTDRKLMFQIISIDQGMVTRYQGLIGVLQCACELGRVDSLVDSSRPATSGILSSTRAAHLVWAVGMCASNTVICTQQCMEIFSLSTMRPKQKNCDQETTRRRRT